MAAFSLISGSPPLEFLRQRKKITILITKQEFLSRGARVAKGGGL